MRVLFGVHPLIRPLKVSVPALQQSLPVIWGVLAVGVFLIWRSGAYFGRPRLIYSGRRLYSAAGKSSSSLDCNGADT
jgi:hypothetical protein